MHPCLFNFRFNLKEALKLKHNDRIIVMAAAAVEQKVHPDSALVHTYFLLTGSMLAHLLPDAALLLRCA